jgi:cystathionine beta-lyase/cystathionine gamma-synthase
MSPQDRDSLGITGDLIRVSTGIEGTQDLVGDFAQALEKSSP